MRGKYLRKLFTLKRIKAFTKKEMDAHDGGIEVVHDYVAALIQNDHQRHKCAREILYLRRAQEEQVLRGKMKHKEPLNYLVLKGIRETRGYLPWENKK